MRLANGNIARYKERFSKRSEVCIIHSDVQYIDIDCTANKFFFFNPFHLKVYIRVLKSIERSLQEKSRPITIYHCHPDASLINYTNSTGSYNLDYLQTRTSVHNGQKHEQLLLAVYSCKSV